VSTLKASELKGRAVVSLAQAEKIGTVDSVIFDPATSRVLGLKVKTGLLGGAKWLRASDIRSIGADAVTINDRSLLHDRADEVPEIQEMPTLDDLVDMKVVSHGGVLLGTLGDIEMDAEQYQIIRYQMSGSFWDQLTHAQKTFGAAAGLRFGKDLLIVPDEVAAELNSRGARLTPAPAEGPGPDADTAPATTDHPGALPAVTPPPPHAARVIVRPPEGTPPAGEP